MSLSYFISFAYFIIIIAIVYVDCRTPKKEQNKTKINVCVYKYWLAKIAWDKIKSNRKKNWEQQPMTKGKEFKNPKLNVVLYRSTS